MANERIKLLEVDIDVEKLLKRAADAKKQIEQLKSETKFFTDAIVETNKTIESHNDVLVSMQKQGKQNTQEYKDRKAEVEALTKANEDNRQKLELQTSALRKQQQEYRNSQKAVDVFNKTMDQELKIRRETDGSINQLQRALEDNRIVYRSLSAEQRDNKAIGGQLLTLIQQQDSEYKNLQKSIGNTQVDVGNYKNQISELLKENNSLSNSFKAQIEQLPVVGGTLANVYDTVADSLGNVMQSMDNGVPITKALASEVKVLYTQFIALSMNPIGATIAALGAIVVITKFWLDYNESIRENLILINQVTDESGVMADKIRQSVQSVTETYDRDFKETLKEVKSLVLDFGLSYDEALKIYNKGLAKGGALNQEFGDSIREYGVQFKSAGYSAEEFISLINAGFDLDVYTDKLPDAIKEASLSLTNPTKEIRENLIDAFGATFTSNILKKIKTGQISIKEGLEDISIESKKSKLNNEQWGALTSSIFRGAGEDAGGAELIFKAVYKSIEDLNAPLTAVEQKQEDLRQSLEDLEKAKDDAFKSDSVIEFQSNLDILWNKIKTNAVIAFSEVVRIGVDGFTQISAGVNTLNNYLYNVERTLGNISFDNLKKSWNDFKNAVTNFDWSETYESYAGSSSLRGQLMDQAKKALNDVNEEILKETQKIIDKNKPKDVVTSNNKGDDSKKDDDKKKRDAEQREKEAEQRRQKQIDAEIKKSEILLKIYLNENDKINSALDQRVNFFKTALDKETSILNTKLKQNRITQEEYDLEILQKKKEYADKISQATAENLAYELDLYIAQNQTKIDYEKSLTEELVKGEEERQRLIYDKRISLLEEQRSSELISEQDFILQKLELQNEYLQQQKELEDSYKLQKKENEQAEFELDIETRRLRKESDFQLEYESLENERLQAIEDAKKKGVDVEKVETLYAERKKVLDKSVQDAKLTGYAAVLGSVKDLFGQETAVGKAAAIAETTINTYKAAQSAYSAMAGIPIVGPALGAVAAGIAVAGGLKNIQKIVSTKTKYQDGGLIEGNSHSFGGVPFTVAGKGGFEAEGGEFIVNKKSTASYLPLLQMINKQAGFNKPQSATRFLNGGIVTGKFAGANNNTNVNIDVDSMASKIGQQVSEANKNLPHPIVAVEDINSGQKNYSEVVNGANITG